MAINKIKKIYYSYLFPVYNSKHFFFNKSDVPFRLKPEFYHKNYFLIYDVLKLKQFKSVLLIFNLIFSFSLYVSLVFCAGKY